MRMIGRTELAAIIAFGVVGCSPPCTDLAALPVLPAGALSNSITTNLLKLSTNPGEPTEVTNAFAIPARFSPSFMVKLSESNSILVAKPAGITKAGKLFPVAGTNVVREIENPSGNGDIDVLHIVSAEPLVFVVEAFQSEIGRNSRYETWLYNESNRVSRKISEGSFGSAVSPDGRKIAWKKGVIDKQHVEVMDLATGKKTSVLTSCGEGSQLPSPKLFWADATNLVACGEPKSLWNGTVVFDVTREKLWRIP